MVVQASPETAAAAAEAAAAMAAAMEATTPDIPTTEVFAAPPGWQKKLTVKKGGTPKRRDVIFVAPSGEEIKSKVQLERYLKKNPGEPAITDFDWSTGETPRRSERLSAKTKVSPTSAEADLPKKRSKKKTPSKDSKDDEDKDITPSEKETPVKDHEGVEAAVAKLFETSEDDNVISKPSEESEAVKESKEHEGTNVEALESMEVETKDNERVEPELVVEVKEDAPVVQHVQDLKEAENIETDQTNKETLTEVTNKDVDAEMVDAAVVTPNMQVELATAVKEDLKVSEEVIAEEKGTVNGDFKLEQSIGVEASVEVVAQEISKDVEFTEGKKETVVDGHQDAINGDFSADESHRQEKHADMGLPESEHEKPEINTYFSLTKPQEAHPAEVGVSS